MLEYLSGRGAPLHGECRRFDPFHPDSINITTMKFYSVEHWQEHWEELISKVENGESIGITNGKHKAVMVPADEELIRIHTTHDDAS